MILYPEQVMAGFTIDGDVIDAFGEAVEMRLG